MIEWMVSSSVLMIVIMTIRYFFRNRLSMRARYALWLLVAVRLLMPFSFPGSSFSVLNFPAVENMLAIQEAGSSGEKNRENQAEVPGGQQPDAEERVSGNGNPDKIPVMETVTAVPDPGRQRGEDRIPQAAVSRAFPWLAAKRMGRILPWIWILGIGVCSGIVLAANANYRKKMYRSRKKYDTGIPGRLPVYVSPLVTTPCLFGILHPAIYITARAARESGSLRYILCHENTHYRHRDNLWALVRMAAVCIHWYNPLVWLGAYLSRQDCELACDEETLKLLGERERIPYGRTLLDYSVQADMVFGRLQLSTTMSGGKKQLKERLLVIAIQQPRRYAGALAAAFVLALLVSAATFTGRAEGKEAQSAGTGETFLTGEAESPDAAMGENSGRETDDNQRTVGAGDDDAERVAFDLKEGESYVLKLGSEVLPDSGMYRTQWLELARIQDGREEVVQTLAADEIGVLYTGAWQQNLYEEGSMYGFSSEHENLYAKPLYQIEDAKERNGEIQFDASEGGILLADLNFDGYQDICLQGKTDGVNIPYYCFLWNPDEACLEPAYMIPNVRADREAQWIVSATREADGRDSVKYYRFDNDNLLHMVRYTEKNESPGAVFSSLDLTYCETSYSLPAVDEWDLGTVYGGALTERMVTWAKQALTELYEWTGTKLDTAYFSVTSFGDFSFGQNAGDLQASRTFYSRCYGDAAGFESVIRHMVLSTEREVWYSPVTQWKVPEDKDKMTDRQLVEWYFERSALTEGEVADSVQKTDDMDYVIRTESGLYYELTLEASTREVNQVYGPYEEFPVH